MTDERIDDSRFTQYLDDARATRALGARLAQIARPGTVILLDGPLGAGKTTLVQGFTEALGARQAASPSFVLAHRYDGGELPVSHLDLYRIDDPREIEELDLDLYLPADGVALIEWAGRTDRAWPLDRIEVELSIVDHSRSAAVRGFGALVPGVRSIASARHPA